MLLSWLMLQDHMTLIGTWRMLVFRNVYFRNKVIQPDPSNSTRNALTSHRAITGNKTIMNHESFRKRMELPVKHFTQSIPGCHLYSTGKAATKLCR